MERYLTLFDREITAQNVKGITCQTEVSRTWCNPSEFVDVVGVDFGGGDMYMYSSSSRVGWKVRASHAMSEILGLNKSTLLVCEWAHLATPRTTKSLSQPFSAADLLELYRCAKSRGITIKLFPHYHTGTARAWAASHFPGVQSADKDDPADAMALSLYVLACNQISLADPPSSFAADPNRDYGRAVREYSSIALNAERTTGYAGRFFPNVVHLGQEIYTRRGKPIGKNACYSIASLIATESNSCPVMFARNGRPPGVEMWWQHVAMMTPFHHKGGIARSNLMRHSFRPFLRRFGNHKGVAMGRGVKITPFGDHDDVQAKVKAEAMRSFRDTIKDCYRVGVDVATKRGFGKIDPVATTWRELETSWLLKEAQHGR